MYLGLKLYVLPQTDTVLIVEGGGVLAGEGIGLFLLAQPGDRCRCVGMTARGLGQYWSALGMLPFPANVPLSIMSITPSTVESNFYFLLSPP